MDSGLIGVVTICGANIKFDNENTEYYAIKCLVIEIYDKKFHEIRYHIYLTPAHYAMRTFT